MWARGGDGGFILSFYVFVVVLSTLGYVLYEKCYINKVGFDVQWP